MNEKASVSFSIVTYNNQDEIRHVLQSILGVDKEMVSHVYVIDNCSIDNTVKIIQEEYKDVECIVSKENVGYGAGHNVAIGKTNAKYHIIVNPDIVFEKEAIRHVIEYMENNSQTVMCIPRIIGFDNKEQYTPRKDPTIRLLLGSLLGDKCKLTAKWNKEYRMAVDTNEPFDIEFCSGCFMVIRTSALQKVNGFDPGFFLYFEDADLSRRIRKLGKIQVVPTASVLHEGKREARKNIKGLRRFIKSAIRYFHKWGWKVW